MIDLERFQKGLNELGEKLDSLGEDKYEELTEMKQRLDLLAQDYAGVVADRWYLTEQVAQLTAERNEARATLERIAQQSPLQFERLESENARLTEALAGAKENLRAANIAYDRLERDRDAAHALLGELGVWADTYGSALTPHGGAADTYGDGVRACKTQVKMMLSSQPAAPLRCSPDPFGGCRVHGQEPIRAEADE